MSDTPELPPRPLPPRRVGSVGAQWVVWFGTARLVVVALCVVSVVAGAYWLVRAPAPSTEAVLPVAIGSGSAGPDSTLPPPGSGPRSEPVAPVAGPAVEPVVEPTVEPVVVHVAGAVTGPGVYRLQAGARVHMAIDAAGGAAADADLDGLNLAALVADGQRIYVPVVGEVDPAAVPSAPPGSADVDVPAGPLDLNRATATELETLPGVGPATAAAIVDDRERHGPFASVDELDRVPGIGPAKLDALRGLVMV